MIRRRSGRIPRRMVKNILFLWRITRIKKEKKREKETEIDFV